MKIQSIKILVLSLLVLPALLLSSCNKGDAIPVVEPVVEQPAKPDPVKLLQAEVAKEQTLRESAEVQLSEEVVRSEKLQTLTVALGLLSVIVFIVGTSVGSRGRRHAIPS